MVFQSKEASEPPTVIKYKQTPPPRLRLEAASVVG
jgi:hypothetical protein